MSFALPSLPYRYDSFEPYLDKETMELHHTKHHQTYINNTNAVLKNLPDFSNLLIEDLIKKLDTVPTDIKNFLKNNAGGHINHSLFWNILKKGTILQGELKKTIERNFISIDNFKKNFEEMAMTVFGSGWIWLVKKDSKLAIVSTINQDNPLMGEKISGTSGFPILMLDLWEHSYYLKFKNRRLEYIQAFWNVVNWEEVSIRLYQS